MIFTDGWDQTECNYDYGRMYINQEGRIISSDPGSNPSKTPDGFTQVDLPIAYFLRDLVTECSEFKDKQILVMQNLNHFSPVLKPVGKSIEIDHDEVRNKLTNYSENPDINPEVLHKLTITSLLNSFKGVENIHSVYLPLILSYSDPGVNSAAYMFYKFIIEGFDKFKISNEPAMVPNLRSHFSMLTSERASNLIAELLRINR